jgi:porin
VKHEIPVLDGRRWCQGRTADAHGIELPYNVEITPWLHITPDLQVIVRPGGGFRDRETAIVYGLRMQVSF